MEGGKPPCVAMFDRRLDAACQTYAPTPHAWLRPATPREGMIQICLCIFVIGDHAFEVFGLFDGAFFNEIGLNKFHISGQRRIGV